MGEGILGHMVLIKRDRFAKIQIVKVIDKYLYGSPSRTRYLVQADSGKFLSISPSILLRFATSADLEDKEET